jgi:hypothetical protein
VSADVAEEHGEEALSRDSLNLCCEEKQLNLHAPARPFVRPPFIRKMSLVGGGFAGNVGAHARAPDESHFATLKKA